MNLRKLTLLAALLLGPAVPAALCAQPAPAAAPVAPADPVLVELGRQLTERFQVRGELQLELMRPVTGIAASATGPLEIVILSCPARLSSSLLLQVRFLSGGRTLSEQSLSLKVQVLRDAFVCRVPSEREAPFDPSQCDLNRVDVLRERDAVAASDLEGEYSYVTAVPAGRILTWRDLTRRALVRKGQLIEVAAVDGMLTITTQAIAMENGAAGDAIRVRNLTSKKDFTAYVVAEARAQVRF
jgi:flagella basal body P-ring formation protein FlgA